MVLMMPLALYITGDGNLIQGSGSTSVLWAVIVGIVAAWAMNFVHGEHSVNELMRLFMKGAGGMLPIATILLFALALGDIANLLGTGVYVANVVGATVAEPLLAPLVFITSAFIAFSVGSSWGTFAIMIPIAIPIATTLDLPMPLLLGAAISGAIFGDHASPISDTTVVASMASATDHIDHVRAVAGIDHIGIGGDYDGTSSLPVGLEDVSTYPALVVELLRRGYSDEEVRKILGKNVLRVMREAERVAGR